MPRAGSPTALNLGGTRIPTKGELAPGRALQHENARPERIGTGEEIAIRRCVACRAFVGAFSCVRQRPFAAFVVGCRDAAPSEVSGKIRP